MRLSAVLALTALACGDEQLAAAPPPSLPPLPVSSPAAPGPYAIGVTTFTVASEGRSLPVEVWYPAVSTGEPVAYALMVGVLTLAELPSPLGAVRDAALDRRGAPHPLVVFSHGFGGTRVQSVYLTEQLASHGFVVAAPDHVGNTLAEQVDQAKAIPAAEMARLRPLDITHTVDGLLARSADFPGDPLGASIDPARIGVAGHSFGGYTALRIAGASVDVAAGVAACEGDPELFFCEGFGATPFPASARDERIVAALPQAPGGADLFLVTDPGGFDDVAVPTMIQAGTADQTTPFPREAEAPFEALHSPAYLLAIDGAGHFTFSDLCSLVEQIGLTAEEFDDGCSPANVPIAEAHPLVTRFATAFLGVHVAGETSWAGELAPGTLAGLATLSAK